MTYYHARIEKQNAWNKKHGAAEAADAARRAAARADAAFVQAHPEIGALVRKGKPVYYVNSPAYRESSDPRSLV